MPKLLKDKQTGIVTFISWERLAHVLMKAELNSSSSFGIEGFTPDEQGLNIWLGRKEEEGEAGSAKKEVTVG